MEWLRKLTANYTEDEYKSYLFDEPQKYDKWWFDYDEIKQPDGDYKYIDKKKTEWVKCEPPHVDDSCSFKDMAIALSETAKDTGYEVEFLYSMVMEYVNDGETFVDAVNSVIATSYERDW